MSCKKRPVGTFRKAFENTLDIQDELRQIRVKLNPSHRFSYSFNKGKNTKLYRTLNISSTNNIEMTTEELTNEQQETNNTLFLPDTDYTGQIEFPNLSIFNLPNVYLNPVIIPSEGFTIPHSGKNTEEQEKGFLDQDNFNFAFFHTYVDYWKKYNNDALKGFTYQFHFRAFWDAIDSQQVPFDFFIQFQDFNGNSLMEIQHRGL